MTGLRTPTRRQSSGWGSRSSSRRDVKWRRNALIYAERSQLVLVQLPVLSVFNPGCPKLFCRCPSSICDHRCSHLLKLSDRVGALCTGLDKEEETVLPPLEQQRESQFLIAASS